MAKKGRNKKFQIKEASKDERGFTVVDENGKRVYLSSHPEGISEKEAQALSEGLVIKSEVVPIASLIE